jgi:hypothetical protein
LVAGVRPIFIVPSLLLADEYMIGSYAQVPTLPISLGFHPLRGGDRPLQRELGGVELTTEDSQGIFC